MRKIKLFICICLTLIFTGCEVNYDIEFVNEDIIEETTISESILNIDKKITANLTEGDQGQIITFGQMLEEELNAESYAVEGNELYKYKKKKILNNDIFGLKQEYKFDISNYSNSSTANMCYKFFKFYSLDDLYIMSTNKQFDCFDYNDLDNVTIHIKSNHKVKDTNAHEVEGYNYYWYLKNDSYSDNSIYIEFYKDKYIFNYENKLTYIGLGTVLVAILVFIVIIILRNKSIKNNRI